MEYQSTRMFCAENLAALTMMVNGYLEDRPACVEIETREYDCVAIVHIGAVVEQVVKVDEGKVFVHMRQINAVMQSCMDMRQNGIDLSDADILEKVYLDMAEAYRMETSDVTKAFTRCITIANTQAKKILVAALNMLSNANLPDMAIRGESKEIPEKASEIEGSSMPDRKDTSDEVAEHVAEEPTGKIIYVQGDGTFKQPSSTMPSTGGFPV
jgi:hypothetical protein